MLEAQRRGPEIKAPTWIMARRQTAARGRRGRVWTAPQGNFAATLVLPLREAAGQAALRSFIAAIALRQTLALCIDAERLSLKWPNDVLLDGGKVAGILLESSAAGPDVSRLAIGIGVNLREAPDVAQVEQRAVPPVSVAGQGGTPHSQDDMLFWLACHFADLEASFRQFGFAPIRRLWLDNAARLGQPITARTSLEEHHGTFDTVDDTGNLILRTPTGTKTIPAADIYF